MKNRGRLCAILSMISIFSCVVLPVANAEVFDIGEIVESDAYRPPFTSGVSVYGEYVNATEIFDGDLSTGIDYENDSWVGGMFFELYFSYPIFVNNITVKSSFGGGKSSYHLELSLNEGQMYFGQNLNDDILLSLNCSINYLLLIISSNGTGHVYFNDVIISYTPSASNLEGLQVQIDDITQQLYLLNNNINELNNSIYEINQTQEQIIENITNLYSAYNQLNDSFANFFTEIAYLNNSVFQLESENTILKEEIQNLTTRVDNLESTEKEIIIEKDPDNKLVYAALGSGILGIIIALVAIILISRKLKSQEPSNIKEESEDEITS
jgi:hypothetical protein